MNRCVPTGKCVVSFRAVIDAMGRSATLATLTCGRGGVLRCTMARRTGGVFSFGDCKDADGNEYKLRF
jgi:hypothetical protein